MKKAILAGICVISMVLATGCSASSNMAAQVAAGASEKDTSTSSSVAVQEAGTAEDAGATTGETTPEAGVGEIAAASEEKIIRDYFYEIETLDFSTSVSAVDRICSEMGGYMQESSVEGDSLSGRKTLRSAHFVLRIPAEKTGTFQQGLEELGTVRNQSSTSQRVTEEYFDIESRLKSLRAQEERLLELLEQSGTMEEIITVEQALADVTYQIEKLTGELKRYDSLTQYSTVTIDLYEVLEPSPDETIPVTLGEKIGAQFQSTLRGMAAVGENLLIIVIGGLPVFAVIAVVVVVICLIVRRHNKRAEKKKQEAMKALEDKQKPEE